jgi:hypothetical protein
MKKSVFDQVHTCLRLNERYQEYFKIGVSDEFILMRRDFPMKNISPDDFSKLILRMFKENEEALRNGK